MRSPPTATESSISISGVGSSEAGPWMPGGSSRDCGRAADLD
jgi:hypothetical protein